MRIEQSTLGLGDPAQLLIIKVSGVHILYFILFYFIFFFLGLWDLPTVSVVAIESRLYPVEFKLDLLVTSDVSQYLLRSIESGVELWIPLA